MFRAVVTSFVDDNDESTADTTESSSLHTVAALKAPAPAAMGSTSTKQLPHLRLRDH